MNIQQYFEKLSEEVNLNYGAAEEARSKGLDPVSKVEVPIATSLAERVIGLVSVLYPQVENSGITGRIAELEKEYGPLDPAIGLKIAEEIAKEKFCKFSSHLEAMEAGIRVAMGYLTLGYVSSPIEGFIQLKIKKTLKGEDYFAPYYSGPIRSAGGTEAAFSLVVVDYLREIFGYAVYDPTEEEIKRGIHECYEYHERINNLQYLPSEIELDFLMRNLPIQVSGDPSEDREVYNYKDVPRVETNFIRSGFALVMGEGFAQKAPKILKRVNALKGKGFKLTGWMWLEEFVKLQKKIKDSKSTGSTGGATYIQDIVAGRPVFGHPSKSGGFRLRYGRCRNTGYSTLAIHPASMAITGNFIAVGTQLKTEKPTKGCTIASCDSIDGPIVLMKDGSVKKVNSFEEGKECYANVKKIIYLGDLLVPYGDFINRNHSLEKPGYVEQFWLQQARKAYPEASLYPSFEEAIELSSVHNISLHPSFIYFWREIEIEYFYSLIDWISHGEIKNKCLVLPYLRTDKERFAKGKEALETIGCEHKVVIENVVLSEKDTKSLLYNLGADITTEKLEEGIEKINRIISKSKDIDNALELVNKMCKAKVEDKSGTFIGARMGRPEKAKLRKLTGSPHVLFPVGDEGGRLRSVQAAVEKGVVKAGFSLFYCDACLKEGIYPKCEVCGNQNRKVSHKMQSDYNKDFSREAEYKEMNLDIKHYFDNAKKKTGLRTEDLPVVVKGVRGTSNKDHSCEFLGKGFLRARYNLHVNKDGTIRYDMTEMPITHFRPAEIGTSVGKLKEMGYEKDAYGKELEKEDQLLEIFPHDIILPACPETPDEKADDVFVNVSKFIDDEFEKLYEIEKFFNIQKKDELIGALFGCMSPHTSVAAVGRLIGFSKVQALLSSPYLHAAMRRDCDGDEAAVMLLMDLLVNFSRKFIPSHRGGTQDAPLVLNIRIRANEVDDMIFDLDVSKEIPLELYEAAKEKKHPSEVKIERVKNRLGGNREFTDLWFSYDTSNINSGALCSSYKTLPTMSEKVDAMMNLCSKIRAVDVRDAARLIIERHFIRDIRGNFRKFSMQVFRCVSCNSKFRRPPLIGKCSNCGGRIIFTISEGSIIKYLEKALFLARNYEVSNYLIECLELVEKDIQGMFGKESEKQEALGKWFNRK